MIALIRASRLSWDISEAYRMPALCKDRRTDDARAAACCWLNQHPCCDLLSKSWDSEPTSPAWSGTLHTIGADNLTWLQRGLFIHLTLWHCDDYTRISLNYNFR
jgi:hypothetical protein